MVTIDGKTPLDTENPKIAGSQTLVEFCASAQRFIRKIGEMDLPEVQEAKILNQFEHFSNQWGIIIAGNVRNQIEEELARARRDKEVAKVTSQIHKVYNVPRQEG